MREVVEIVLSAGIGCGYGAVLIHLWLIAAIGRRGLDLERRLAAIEATIGSDGR